MKNLIACLVVCVLSGVVTAEVHHVPADFPTIQYAIDAAVNGDEIIVAPGTYPPGIDMRGKEIWLHSSKGAQVTIIDGGGAGLGIRCDNNETSNTIIEGFTITNCFRGMYNTNSSSPTLTNCSFTNNSTTGSAWDTWGGGMYNTNSSSPTLTNCTFENNNVVGFGGGMANEYQCNPTLTNCSFTGNSAQFSSYYDEGRGGGMYNEGSNPTLTNCSFTGNTAEGDMVQGGGMYNEGSNPTLINCSFTNNSTTGGGGGICSGGSSNPTLDGCTFTNNYAGAGAMACGLATITGCVFIQNIGGGIVSSGSNKSNSPTISSSSFCENEPYAISGNWNNGGGNDFLNDCGDVEGACCVKEACYEVEFLFCDAIGGEWLGYNETCEVDTCSTPPQYGACCINGEAIPLFDYDCIRILGAFMGEGTNPDDVTCPVHCAEDVTGDGLIDVSDLLAIIGVWGACP